MNIYDFKFGGADWRKGQFEKYQRNYKGYKIFKIKKNIILPKYLLYFLKTSAVINKIDLMKESGARNRFDFEKWKKIEISIPAIEVQQKIVNILDSFETLVKDIKQGLPREIELRQKQYEYYREKLLTFDAE